MCEGAVDTRRPRLHTARVRSPDVVVIGGGVMGCAVALRLAQRGARTLVLERSVPGAEASSVAAGILAPQIEHARGSSARALGIESRERHSQLANELRATLGIDVGLRRSGAMVIALEEHEAEALGEEGERITGTEARRREPRVSERAIAAIDLSDEAQLEPPLLLRALAIGAERAGATFRSGATVRGVRLEHDRARGVVTEDGTIDADHVVVAAGSWTGTIAGLPAIAAAVRPIRGQLVHAETRTPIASRILFGAGGYIVPRPDGRVICGATMEDAGFRKDVTVGGALEVLARATRLVPALGAASLTGHAVNFRPASPDELPLVGPAGPLGLWLATGHHRNGILLAPVTADAIAEAITGATSSIERVLLDAIDPRRFARPA